MAPQRDVYTALRSPRAPAKPANRTPEACAKTTRSTSDDDIKDAVVGAGDPAPAVAPSVPLWALYRFATRQELAMLVAACVCAAINGVMYPCMALVFGHAIAAFDPFDQDAVDRAAMEYLAIAVALLVTDVVAFAMFGSLSERQARAMREAVLHRLLHYDLAWFDLHDKEAKQLVSRITSDTIKIKNGMGPKLGDSIKFTAQCVGGFVIGFVQSWDLALIMSCLAPLSMWSMSYLLRMVMGLAKQTQKLYAEAGAVAEETLSSMRTVQSLNGERRAIEKYDAKSRVVEVATIDVFRRVGVVQGIFTSSVWLMYGAGLWYGGWKVYTSEVPPSTVFQAFFGITLGTWSLGMVSPNVAEVAEAMATAGRLFKDLDRVSAIDSSSDVGLRPITIEGELVFRDVHFAYPSRPDAPVLRGLDVTISVGQTVAFVGPSGGGKSTIIALLERFYDPQAGEITLDGHDLRDLNVSWLRAQIGLVSQEPVLFAMTVFDNIAAGRASAADVTKEEVEAAARLANAHDFIMQLPDKYNTFVGENGSSLSGGQKQRIAIARAIVRRPWFLVLDEATSALDNTSERVVQDALNNVMRSQQQMATIVIAHRLSTIRAANKIVVMANGQVAEVGTHAELVAYEDGIYRAMVDAQALEEHRLDGTDGQADEVKAELEHVAPLVASTVPATVTKQVAESHPILQESTAESSFTLMDAMRLSAPEATYYVVGMVAAVIHGVMPVVSALLVSAVVALLTEKYGQYLASGNGADLRDIADSVRFYGIYYLIGALTIGTAHYTQVRCFRLMSAKLMTRLRSMHFHSLCRQDIAYFDDPKHSTGALSSDLAAQAAKTCSVSGDAQSRIIQVGSTLVAAVGVAFVSGSLVLTLIMLVILPFILAGEYIRAKYSNGKMLHAEDLSEAGSEASQALNNVRTVVAFGLEQHMCSRFSAALNEPMHKGKKEAKVTGLAVGYSSFVLFATYALVFWYGGVLVGKGDISFKELIRTLMAIIMASQPIGFAMSWAAEALKALDGGRAIFEVRDRPHAIDALCDDEGRVLNAVQGRIELRDVVFRYPTRPEVAVLNGFNLTIEANETIGFCGTSGGGKSTVVALIERFYDPLGGQVLLDGDDLRELRVSWLRRQIGYVGQEPTLFIGTIAENIAYGLDQEPSQDEIERVSRLANAHDFISHLPDKYGTQVGAKGEQLSGGQKQRIAIARALLRQPRILILDEATSALDSESERIVQDALDTVVATQQCTTLIIAHRLSTLRTADRICVVDQGRVAELGSHDALVRHDGLYARLLNGVADQ